MAVAQYRNSQQSHARRAVQPESFDPSFYHILAFTGTDDVQQCFGKKKVSGSSSLNTEAHNVLQQVYESLCKENETHV